jgi:hypothetical protein
MVRLFCSLHPARMVQAVFVRPGPWAARRRGPPHRVPGYGAVTAAPKPRWRKIALLAAVALAVAVGVTAGAWALFFRDTTAAVSVHEAVEGFRNGTGGGATVGPEPGVYVYRTEGWEDVDALLGARHDYPAVTTVTVRAGGCGVLLAWAPLRERTTTWEWCPQGGGVAWRRFTEVHTFFGNRDVQDYRCDPPRRFWLPGLAMGESWTSRCAAQEKAEDARLTVVGLETVEVGGEQLEAIHVREEISLSGVTSGSGTRDWWLEGSTGLPLRLEIVNTSETESAIGGVNYRERAELLLVSLEPRR